MAWDPTASKPPVWVPIESSRDADGVAQGEVECTPWNAGKRLAYENRVLSEAVHLDYNPETKEPIRRLMPGGLRMLSVLLTVTGTRGFPPGFDHTSPDAWNTLDADVFEEVAAIAATVQPLPIGKGPKVPGDRKVAAVESGPESDEDEGDGDAVDPSRRPSTPAE